MDNLVFHNPNKEIGLIDLGTTQVNKQLLFKFSQAVNASCKVVVHDGSKTIKQYTVGSGIALSNSDKDVLVLG